MIRSAKCLAMCRAPAGRADIQPLHLAAFLIQLPQNDAPSGPTIHLGKIQPPVWKAVLGCEVPKLILMVLSAQLQLKGRLQLKQHGRVLREKCADFIGKSIAQLYGFHRMPPRSGFQLLYTKETALSPVKG